LKITKGGAAGVVAPAFQAGIRSRFHGGIHEAATEVGFRHGRMFLQTIRWMFPRVALADMARHPQSARLKDGRYNGLLALRFSIVSQLVTL